ncbi:hypothetical protein TCAL_12999 [Tigriopus californicus]|uniref:CUB domain-containing protein n=1 Tax=Tigriopus californicus TaxID=6832 RepID=A0A553P376_TIGCA|nr:hypothetical protein TCAL_12999 [Tigriopus californicus]
MLLRFTLSLVFILFNAFFVKATPNNQTSREKRFSLSSGGTSSENNTYLRESSGTAPGSSYTICKSASDICRIRLDLTVFIEAFFVVIVDASDQCHVASFSLGTTPLVTRSWDIKVTQFTCSQEVGATHLSNQHYKLCIRRESGYCSICYAPFSTGSEPDDEVTFGLSDDPVGAECSKDYLVIPAGVDTKTDGDLEATDMSNAQRICGNVFSIDEPTSVSICAKSAPFFVEFKSDGDEAEGTGTPGFSLNYKQMICP